MIKIVTIVGARPQFIKAAAVSRAIAAYRSKHKPEIPFIEAIVHTGQHYDAGMSNVFFDELGIPEPDYNLGVGSGLHGDQTARMLSGIESILIKEEPQCVLIYGDTNSTLAGALAAAKLNILSAHVEAGLRSYNRAMPEEINRLVADEIANFLFCPTKQALENLRREGIEDVTAQKPPKVSIDTRRVFLSGDVMYDSILYYRHISEKRSQILKQLGVSPGKYCLATLHRAENTDDRDRLRNILNTLKAIGEAGSPVILPLHPRTRKCIIDNGWSDEYSLIRRSPEKEVSTNCLKGLIFSEPLGYIDMIRLQSAAKLVFTDSGGVQKEAFFLKVPCITLRTETEWVETVTAGWNRVTGTDPKAVYDAFRIASAFEGVGAPYPPNEEKDGFINGVQDSGPYGDGKAAEKIVDTIWNLFV